jgi:hypothetical protein
VVEGVITPTQVVSELAAVGNTSVAQAALGYYQQVGSNDAPAGNMWVLYNPTQHATSIDRMYDKQTFAQVQSGVTLYTKVPKGKETTAALKLLGKPKVSWLT